jgi:hypothetical protein
MGLRLPRNAAGLKRHGILFLVPLLYLVVVLLAQPENHLGNSDVAPWLGRVLYDDFDMTAIALRGYNARLGRTPGAPHPEMLGSAEFRQALNADSPLQPTYFLEYPSGAAAFFTLTAVVPGSGPAQSLPGAILDGWHNNIVEHQPCTAREKTIWRQFRCSIRAYEVVMILCLLALTWVLRQGYEPNEPPPPLWLLVLPGVLYFTLNRFDVVPTLLVALGLWRLGRGHPTTSAILFGLATLLKVYPLLVAPLVVRYLWANRRQALTWAGAYGGTLVVGLALPLLTFGWEASWAPYLWQLRRPLEEAWVFYGRLWPADWSDSRLFRQGTLLLLALLLVGTRPADFAGLLRRCLVMLVVFIGLQVFFSPQWVLWLIPFLVPLARRQPLLLPLAVGLDLVAYLSFPVVFDAGASVAVIDGMVYARAALFLLLLLALARSELSRTRPTLVPLNSTAWIP